MWLYWFCAHPITGCVVLCTQNKKSQGKELNCPMAAAIIMGGVCVCCAPCICIGLCMGIEPLFRKTDVQMPQERLQLTFMKFGLRSHSPALAQTSHECSSSRHPSAVFVTLMTSNVRRTADRMRLETRV